MRRNGSPGAMPHFFWAPFTLYSVVPWRGAHMMGHASHVAEGVDVQ